MEPLSSRIILCFNKFNSDFGLTIDLHSLHHFHHRFPLYLARYKQDLTPDQKTALLDLIRVQRHEGIGPEVRRELTTGAARGEMLEEPLNEDDDAMSL